MVYETQKRPLKLESWASDSMDRSGAHIDTEGRGGLKQRPDPNRRAVPVGG